MSKKIATLIWEIGGKWFGLMSGPPSVLLFVAGAYLYHGTEKDWFWIGAFICLWLFVFQMGWRNYRLMETVKAIEARRHKAAPIVTELVKFGQQISSRISFVKGFEPSKYNPDTDDATWDVIHQTIAYIVLMLNKDAGDAFDKGVASINGKQTPPPKAGVDAFTAWALHDLSQGTWTIYEERHAAMLGRLNKRFENLKTIVDGIDKYLK